MQVPVRRIRVLVAHDSPVVAAGLVAALKAGASFDVEDGPAEPDEPGSVRQAGAPIDVVVVDYFRGLQWLRKSLDRDAPPSGIPPRILVISASDREAEVRDAIAAGVHGFLLTNCEISELVRSVGVLAAGGRYFCPSAASRMADSLCQEAMTPRESDVMALLMKGLSNKMIARELGIAVGTAKAHVKAILAKLGVTTRLQAVALATRRGLVAADPSSRHEAKVDFSRIGRVPRALPRESRQRFLPWLPAAGMAKL